MNARLAFFFHVLLMIPLSASASDTMLTLMTYNLRFASDVQPNAWGVRRPLVAECIRTVNPDVFGTQEGVYPQLRDIEADLPDYGWIGLGRDGGSRGEFMAVFYRRDRLQPLAFDHFWLSDTPQVIGSTTWGNKNRRMVTWVRFRDLRTQREFYFWNTHFDHEVQQAREKSAALLRARMAELEPRVPVVLVGDFNAAAGENPAYQALVADGFLVDTWNAARERRNETYGTFNGFGETPLGGSRIDWILTRGAGQVAYSEVVTFRSGEQYPSDHYPVVARIELGQAAP